MYIVIAGAGLVGRGLAEQLVQARHDVVAIDRDREVCEWLSSRLGVMAVCGSATSVDILEQAGISKADVAVATMRVDADNLAFSLLSKGAGVGRIIARMRDKRYDSAYEEAGVTTTIHVAQVFVSQLLLEIEEPHLRQVATLGGGKASIVVDTIPEGAAVAGKTLSEIAAADEFPSECVVTGIYRSRTHEFVIPRGRAQLHTGDRVFLLAARRDLKKASRFLHRT